MVRQAVEGQIGMLTCQVIELQVQLQLAHQQIGRLNTEAEQMRLAAAALAEPPPDTTS